MSVTGKKEDFHTIDNPPRQAIADRRNFVPSNPSTSATGNAATKAGLRSGKMAIDLRTHAKPSRFRACRKKHRAVFSQCWDSTRRRTFGDLISGRCFFRNLSIDWRVQSGFDGPFSWITANRSGKT
jgi:hypothetical protein